MWAKREAIDTRATADQTSLLLIDGDGYVHTYSVHLTESTTVSVPVFYYPHWKVAVDGQTVDAKPDENGLISFPVVSSTSNVRITFEEPIPTRAAGWLSLGAWALVAFLLVRKKLIELLRLLRRRVRFPAEQFDLR